MSMPQTANRRSDYSFSNWAELAGGRVEAFYEPESLAEIVGIVRDAESAGKRVRAVGSGWAYEEIAYSPEVMISLARLNSVLDYVTDLGAGALLSPTGSNGRRLVHVEGGMKIATLNAQLAARGLAMPTLGGSNGQSIVGALATSTHGADFDEPPFCDLIRAIHLIGVGGQEYWLERAIAPITLSARLGKALPSPDTLIIRDDEAFDAVAVGLGRFGVIYSVIVEAVPAYSLAQRWVLMPLPRAMESLRRGMKEGTFLEPLLAQVPPPPSSLNTMGRPRAMQLLIDPRNPQQSAVKLHWLATGPPAMSTPSNQMCDLGVAGILGIASAGLIGLGMNPLFVEPAVLLDPGRLPRLTAKAAQLGSPPYPRRPGDAFAKAVNAFWEFGFTRLPDALSALGYWTRPNNERGPSYAIMTGGAMYDANGKPRPHELFDCYKSNSCEIVFDAWDPHYLAFVESLAAQAPRFQQAGYISLRFCARSRAFLSMHNVASKHAASIEVATFVGLRDSAIWIDRVLAEAQAMGGRPHWGQQNHTTAGQIAGLYGDALNRWRAVLGALSGGSTLFSNAFTVKRGLEPQGTRDLQIEGVASELASAVDVAATTLLLGK
jgi:hypothetical protein